MAVFCTTETVLSVGGGNQSLTLRHLMHIFSTSPRSTTSDLTFAPQGKTGVTGLTHIMRKIFLKD